MSMQKYMRWLEKGLGFFHKIKFVLWGTGVLQFSKFFTVSIIAYILDPIEFGLFQIFFILMTYFSNCNLGVLNALNRNVPFYMSRGNADLILLIKRNSLRFAIFSSLVMTLGTLIYAFISSNSLRQALIFNAIILIFQEFYLYNEFVLKSEQAFPKLAIFQSLFAVNLILFTVVLGYSFQLVGVYLAYLISFFNCGLFIILYFKVQPLAFDFWNLRLGVVFELIKVGFPVMLVGFIYTILLTCDRFIILKFYSIKEVGYYSLMNILNGLMQFLAIAMATVLYPDIMSRLGGGQNYWMVFKRISRFSGYATAVFIAIYVILILVMPSIIVRFYPKYLPFLSFYHILLIGIIFLNLNYFNGVFFNATRKQFVFILIQILSIAASLAVNFYICKNYNFGLKGVAVVFSVTAFLNYISSFVYSWRLCASNKNITQEC